MSRLCRFLVLAMVAFVAADLVKPDSDSDFDLVEEIQQLQPFMIRSSPTCPVLVIGTACPEANPLFYYKCCGELNKDCCFRLQDWATVLLAVLAVIFVVSIVVSCIRCLCCSRSRN